MSVSPKSSGPDRLRATFTDLADYLDDEDVWACAPARCLSRRTRLLHASSIAPKSTTRRPERRSEPAEHAPVERVELLADHRR